MGKTPEDVAVLHRAIDSTLGHKSANPWYAEVQSKHQDWDRSTESTESTIDEDFEQDINEPEEERAVPEESARHHNRRRKFVTFVSRSHEKKASARVKSAEISLEW